MQSLSQPLRLIVTKPATEPPPPSATKMVYDGQFVPGTGYQYAFSSSHDFSDDGRYLFGGPPVHESPYVDTNRNAINAWTPPAIGAADSGVLEALYPRNPKHGWIGTDEFVRWYIPQVTLPDGSVEDLWLQQWQVAFGLTSRKIHASNIAAYQQAAGDPVEPIPPMSDFVEKVGNVADNTGFAPYEPAHAWSREHDCGITIGGSHSADRGICMTKQPGNAKPLRIKVYYMPQSARHPQFPTNGTQGNYPQKSISSGCAFGDWFYVVGPQYPGWKQAGFTNSAPTFFRVHIPSILACPPHGRLPDAAFEYLPSLPFLYPNGPSYIFNGLVNRDFARNSIIIFNTRVVEFKPHDDPAQFQFADVTPDGWPTLGMMCGGYDRVTNAHYIGNGYVPPNVSCTNLLRPRVGQDEVAGIIGQPDPAIVTSVGNPPFMNTTRFHRFRFPD